MGLPDNYRKTFYNSIGDDITVYDIKLAEGLDWQLKVYIRENLDAEIELKEGYQTADSHYIQISLGSGVPSSPDPYEATFTIRELEQVVDLLSDQLKKYKKQVKTIAKVPDAAWAKTGGKP